MTVTHSVITTGRAGTAVGLPTGGWVETAEVDPDPGPAHLLFAISTYTTTGIPNVPTISGLGLDWGLLATDVDEEVVNLGTPHARLLVAYGTGTPSSGVGRVIADFAGQEQADVCWALTSHVGSGITDDIVIGPVGSNNAWAGASGQLAVQAPTLLPTTLTLLGFTASQTANLPSGYTVITTVLNGDQGLKLAAAADPSGHPVWTGLTGNNAIAFAFGIDSGNALLVPGGFLRQRQRSSEQDGLRASFRNRIQ